MREIFCENYLRGKEKKKNVLVRLPKIGHCVILATSGQVWSRVGLECSLFSTAVQQLQLQQVRVPSCAAAKREQERELIESLDNYQRLEGIIMSDDPIALCVFVTMR